MEYNTRTAADRYCSYNKNNIIDCTQIQPPSIIPHLLTKIKPNCLNLITLLLPNKTTNEKHYIILEIPNIHRTTAPCLIYDPLFLTLQTNKHKHIFCTDLENFYNSLQTYLPTKTGNSLIFFFTVRNITTFVEHLQTKTKNTQIQNLISASFETENYHYISKVFANFLLKFHFCMPTAAAKQNSRRNTCA